MHTAGTSYETFCNQCIGEWNCISRITIVRQPSSRVDLAIVSCVWPEVNERCAKFFVLSEGQSQLCGPRLRRIMNGEVAKRGAAWSTCVECWRASGGVRPAVMLQVECAGLPSARTSDCGGTPQSEPRPTTLIVSFGWGLRVNQVNLRQMKAWPARLLHRVQRVQRVSLSQRQGSLRRTVVSERFCTRVVPLSVA